MEDLKKKTRILLGAVDQTQALLTTFFSNKPPLKLHSILQRCEIFTLLFIKNKFPR